MKTFEINQIIFDELEIENHVLKENMIKKQRILDEKNKKNENDTRFYENKINEINNYYENQIKKLKEENIILKNKLEQIYYSRSYKITQKIKKILRRK